VPGQPQQRRAGGRVLPGGGGGPVRVERHLVVVPGVRVRVDQPGDQVPAVDHGGGRTGRPVEREPVTEYPEVGDRTAGQDRAAQMQSCHAGKIGRSAMWTKE
jgi:hypothetical protein